jgi:hypothetical protein
VEVVQGDVLDPDSLGDTMRDVDVVIILSIVAAFSNWSPANADHIIEIGGQDVLKASRVLRFVYRR